MKHTVRYSSNFSFLRGSQIASKSNSKPRTKIRTPTIITGMNPMMEGPMTIIPKVTIASIMPANLLLPPVLIKSTLFVYTR